MCVGARSLRRALADRLGREFFASEQYLRDAAQCDDSGELAILIDTGKVRGISMFIARWRKFPPAQSSGIYVFSV
jgi:hypothetical protein